MPDLRYHQLYCFPAFPAEILQITRGSFERLSHVRLQFSVNRSVELRGLCGTDGKDCGCGTLDAGWEAVLAGITPPVPAGREADGPSLLEVGIMVLMVEFWET